MKIFSFVLLGLFTSVFPRINVYTHFESAHYLNMSRDERRNLFIDRRQPVVYLNRASKLMKNARPRGKRNEWEPIKFSFIYYCPAPNLELEKVIVKFAGTPVVVIEGKNVNIYYPRKRGGTLVSSFEGDIFFKIDRKEAERYINSNLEYVRFISTEKSSCKMNIMLEGFEKDTEFIWAT